jgi:hypothetical protein
MMRIQFGTENFALPGPESTVGGMANLKVPYLKERGEAMDYSSRKKLNCNRFTARIAAVAMMHELAKDLNRCTG